MNEIKLGRKPRKFNPRVPHLSSFVSKMRSLAPAPPSDWTEGMPENLGAMLNNSLGDCTCAGMFHGIQVWTNNNPLMFTTPDSNVLSVYEGACGYNPDDPSTDQGGVEQDVLAYWLNQGIPLLNLGVNNLSAFYEVDPRNLNDVRWTINDCGFSYIGIDVPNYLMQNIEAGKTVWDAPSVGDDTTIEGGHCIILPASLVTGNFKLISWGTIYEMTPGFFSQFCDEAYGLVDLTWITAKGTTPGGLTLTQLEAQMQGLKEAT